MVRLPLLLSLAVCAGIFIGANVFDKSGPKAASISKNAKKFRDVISYIERYYVDSVKSDELTDYAIEKMLERLDPHTSYIPSEEFELANAPLQGNFEGIGIEFNIFKDTVQVVSVVSGGPSEQVGLKPGDRIIKVEGESVAGKDISNMDVVNMLRGEKGSKVKVGVYRKSLKETIDFTITRDKIPTYTVDVSYMLNNNIG